MNVFLYFPIYLTGNKSSLPIGVSNKSECADATLGDNENYGESNQAYETLSPKKRENGFYQPLVKGVSDFYVLINQSVNQSINQSIHPYLSLSLYVCRCLSVCMSVYIFVNIIIDMLTNGLIE